MEPGRWPAWPGRACRIIRLEQTIKVSIEASDGHYIGDAIVTGGDETATIVHLAHVEPVRIRFGQCPGLHDSTGRGAVNLDCNPADITWYAEHKTVLDPSKLTPWTIEKRPTAVIATMPWPTQSLPCWQQAVSPSQVPM